MAILFALPRHFGCSHRARAGQAGKSAQALPAQHARIHLSILKRKLCFIEVYLRQHGKSTTLGAFVSDVRAFLAAPQAGQATIMHLK
jgi:hypothetical protein